MRFFGKFVTFYIGADVGIGPYDCFFDRLRDRPGGRSLQFWIQMKNEIISETPKKINKTHGIFPGKIA